MTIHLKLTRLRITHRELALLYEKEEVNLDQPWSDLDLHNLIRTFFINVTW